MAITAETRQDIMELAVAANNAAPGTTLLSDLVAMSTSGKSLLEIADSLASSASFVATYPTFQTATEFATEFLGNLVPEASADAVAEGVTIIEGMLAAGDSRGKVILEAASYLAALDESNASFGTSAALFNHRVEVATYHTITSEAAAPWAIPASVTSSDDSVATGKGAVDTALAPAPEAAPTAQSIRLTAGQIDGKSYSGAGVEGDAIVATVTNADDDGASFASTDIESIEVRVSGAGNVELIMGDVSGLDTLTSNRLGSNLVLTDFTELTTDFVIKNNSTAAILDVNYEAGVTAGTADAVSVTVDRSTNAEIDLDGIETINLTAINAPAGGTNVIDVDGTSGDTVNVSTDGKLTLAVDVAENVNISGEGAVTMTATVADSVVTSTGSGALALTDSGIDLTATGGSGDDTFAFTTNLDANDSIDGGEGANTVTVTGAGGALIPAKADISNVQTLTATTGGGDTLDASIVSFDNVNVVSGADAHTITATKVTDEVITVTAADDGVAGQTAIALVDVSLADATGTADSLTLNLKNQDKNAAFIITDIDSTGGGIETLTLNLVQGFDVSKAIDTQIVDISSTHTKLVVTGDADAELGSGTALTTKTIDAGGATGDIEVNLGAANQTVTTGSGADTITGGNNVNSSDTIDTGDGTDTVAFNIATAAIIQPTIKNAESLTVDADTASGVLRADKITGATKLTLVGDVTNTVTHLGEEVATVVLAEDTDDEIANITYAAGSSAAHTLSLSNATGAADYAAITVANNAGDFTVSTSGNAYTVTSITNDKAGSLTVSTVKNLDVDGAAGISAAAATDVTVTTAGGAFDISNAAGNLDVSKATSVTLDAANGNLNVTDQLLAEAATTLTLSASKGTLDVGTSILVEKDLSATITASAAEANDITVALLDADFLADLTVTASGAADITLSDILLTGKNAAGKDATTSMTLSADDASTVVTVSDVSAAAATTLDLVTINTSSKGVVSFTTNDGNLTITEIDASGAAADGLVIDVDSIAAATKITLGAGKSTVTTSGNGDAVTAGSGTATINLAGAGDTVVMTGGDATITQVAGKGDITLSTGDETIKFTTAAATEISGFDVENDVIVLDNSVIEALNGTNLVDGNGDNINTVGGLTDTAIVIDDVTSGADYTMDTATSILRLSGAFADTAAVDAELAGAAGRLQDSNFADDDIILVIWSDGVNAHISNVHIDDVDDGVNDYAEVDSVVVTDLVVLLGVAHTDITAASLGSGFPA